MDIQSLKSKIAKTPKTPSGRRKYSAELKRQIIDGRASYQGSALNYCNELGINANQLQRWQQSRKQVRSSDFKELKIKQAKPRQPVITLKGPLGIEIQGTASDIAELLRSLSRWFCLNT